MKHQKIAIIGAGTAGLSVAQMLAQQGHYITVYETAETLAPVGAGLLLQPSGLAVLAHMGLLEAAQDVCARVTGLTGTLPNGRKVVNTFYKHCSSDWFGLGVHRATLCYLLQQSLEGLPIKFRMGHRVESVTQAEQHSTVTYTHNDQQESAQYDLTLICNGARSTLCPEHWVKLNKPYPWGAIWAIVPECDFLDPKILHQYYDGADTMMGILPTGQLYTATKQSGQALSSVFWSMPTTELADGAQAGSVQLSETIKERWPSVAQWVDELPNTTKWLPASYKDVVLTQFGQDNIGVLGDAAHAASPQLGQGTNLALLDAWAFSDAMKRSKNHTELWQRYHQHRIHPVHFYQWMSRRLTPYYQSHSKTLGFIRNTTFPVMNQIPWLRKQMALTVSGVKQGAIAKDLCLNAIRER